MITKHCTHPSVVATVDTHSFTPDTQERVGAQIDAALEQATWTVAVVPEGVTLQFVDCAWCRPPAHARRRWWFAR